MHGNSKKQETAPDGSVDQNVFDIQQGVSINIFVKTGNKKKSNLSQLFQYDLYGKRGYKYEFLFQNSLKSIDWVKLKIVEPNYVFVQRDYETELKYNEGIGLNDLFNVTGSGIKFRKDNLLVKRHFNTDSVLNMISDFELLDASSILKKYQFNETKDWKIEEQRINFKNADSKDISKVNYRPFDSRYAYYPINRIHKIIPRGDSRRGLMRHFLSGDNLALITTKLNRGLSSGYNFISRNILDLHLLDSAGDSLQTFPIYLYPETNGQQTIEESTERTPNLNSEIVTEIAKKLDLTFTNEKEETNNTFAPIDILDYIYAVLHSPTYREKYKEFLKIDFPRVPYPKDLKTFWDLVKLGKEVREIHLLESNKVEDYITSYEMVENAENDHNIITTKIGKKDWEITDTEKQLGRIWINESKYFDNVPVTAWEFYIGGYQPAQKWLKDRKERELKFEDILHYQKIIVALTETDRIMAAIDKIEIE